MRRLLICLAIAGCARAGKENSIIGGLTDARPRGDATEIPPVDASPIDAPPQQTTLSQTTSNAIAVNNSFRCPDGANSYYRMFTLADYSITTTLHVTQVDFGIQDALGGQGTTQPATLHVGTYGGPTGNTTLDLTQVRMISSLDIKIPDGSATTMSVPIMADIAPTTSVIVELAIPDGAATGDRFFIGTNTDGERRPAYTLEPQCGFTDPTSMQSIADQFQFGNVHMVLTVTGTTDTVPN
jgi:hypothetical protein